MQHLLTTSVSLAEFWPQFLLIALCLVFIIFLLFLLFRIVHRSRKEKKARKRHIKQLKAQGMQIMATMKHINGLPIPENANCDIYTFADHIEFHGGNMDMNLSRSKIVGITKTTDFEIQHQAVSSAGGAILGYAALGPLGAAIGGRVKNRTVRTATTYLIITYRDGETFKYIGFDAGTASIEALQMENEHKRLANGAVSAQIDL